MMGTTPPIASGIGGGLWAVGCVGAPCLIHHDRAHPHALRQPITRARQTAHHTERVQHPAPLDRIQMLQRTPRVRQHHIIIMARRKRTEQLRRPQTGQTRSITHILFRHAPSRCVSHTTPPDPTWRGSATRPTRPTRTRTPCAPTGRAPTHHPPVGAHPGLA